MTDMSSGHRIAVALFIVAIALIVFGAVMTLWIPYVAGAILLYFGANAVIIAEIERL